ncbi:rod shape-determining protein [Catenulispora rubra]|uniref:rod shape-determining protein n=1 Tax=Catenulispora rubra TaxID=280293 RepID=UPI0018924BBE|nr:rod shape-determining protein [Catenulispora rubra]
MDLYWWGRDPLRVDRSLSSPTRVVLELAWIPGAGVEASLAAEVLAGAARPGQLYWPIGSVALVAPGAGAHPGVGPAVDTARQLCPAATVTVVEETVAALAGAGLDPEPAACVVVHSDVAHTSVAVVAGREVVARGVAAGGAQGLAQAVIGHLRAEHGLDVGLEEAWIAAVDGGAFRPSASPPVAGPRTMTGRVVAEDGTIVRPQATVTPTELRAVLTPAYQPVTDLVAQVLRDAPPETARQAVAGGLLLTGQHPAGVDEYLAGLSGLPARRTVDPKGRYDRFRTLLDGVDRLFTEPDTRP